MVRIIPGDVQSGMFIGLIAGIWCMLLNGEATGPIAGSISLADYLPAFVAIFFWVSPVITAALFLTALLDRPPAASRDLPPRPKPPAVGCVGSPTSDGMEFPMVLGIFVGELIALGVGVAAAAAAIVAPMNTASAKSTNASLIVLI